jgi:hypothetical protein
MSAIWQVVAFLAALVGGFLVLGSLAPSYSAPQTAAQAAVGIGIAAIPYFIASMAQRAEMTRFLKRAERTEEKTGDSDSVAARVKDFLVGRD